MYSTPRKQRKTSYNSFRSGGHGRGTPSRQPGLFENGQWLCDCTPRLPALRLQVKKQGANKGRWFYTCQRERRDQCGFFLWEDAARAREEAALLLGGAAARSEPRGAGRDGIATSIGPGAPPTPTPAPRQQRVIPTAIGSDGIATMSSRAAQPRQRTFRGVPGGEGELLSDDSDGEMFVDSGSSSTMSRTMPIKAEAAPSSSSSDFLWAAPERRARQDPTAKRKREADDVGGGEDFSDGLDSDMEREMAAMADETAERAARQLTTEPKSLSNDMLGLTPVRPAPQTGLPTPSTAKTKPEAATITTTTPTKPTTPSSHTLTPDTSAQAQTPSTAAGTLPPGSSSPAAASPDEDYPITAAVLRLLPPADADADADAPLTPAARSAVRAELNGHALRVLEHG
ncbi:uncharacterized protein E0L32_003553, partial [Thyridium curvatum]